LALDGARAAMSVGGSIDGDAMSLFVKQSLCQRLRPGEIVYLDNMPTHKMAAMAEAIESVGVGVEFLPEYSPDFSPIEPFWSKVKNVVRSIGPPTVIKLFPALKRAFAAVTLEDILSFLLIVVIRSHPPDIRYICAMAPCR
jgi:transposase